MRILHARDFVVQPWKNGGGMTTEIIVSPPGATFDAFEWRVSMAQVATAGPFSMFAGIDRSLGLLQGQGMTLAIGGRGEIALTMAAHPAVFPGDVPVEATLAGGAILDLNVMTRRGHWRHHLTRARLSGSFDLRRRGDVVLALARGSTGTADGQPFADGDALLLTSDDVGAELVVSAACDLWIADLWRSGVASSP